MVKRGKAFVVYVLIGFVLLASKVVFAQKYVVQIHNFRGESASNRPRIKEPIILQVASNPELSGLKAKAMESIESLTGAVIETLIETQELKNLDDLFVFTKTWDGKEAELKDVIQHEMVYWEYSLKMKNILNGKADIEIILSRDGSKILNLAFTMEIDEPAIIAFPDKDRYLFIMMLIKSDNTISKPRSVAAQNKSAQSTTLEIKPVYQLKPAYPDELRRQGIKGDVGLQVAIDEEGSVIGVTIVKPLHPYLDFASVQALKQWKFEPFIKEGKPIPTIIFMRTYFDPETYRPAIGDINKDSSQLTRVQNIISGCAQYCQKLAEASLFFVCEEKIKEINYDFMTGDELNKLWSPSYMTVIPHDDSAITSYLTHYRARLSPKRTIRNEYICDYQLIRKDGKIGERRVIIKENGKSTSIKEKELEGKRYSIYQPFFALARLFELDRQYQYDYRLIKEESVHSIKTDVIEVMPKPNMIGDVEYARIWIDKSNYQIIKGEIEGIPVEGYEDILKEASVLNIKPKFIITYEFQINKNGVLFPSETKIRASYPRSKNIADGEYRSYSKLFIDMTYEKYKFFTVATSSEIIK